jgi:hypothetical protein
MSLTLDGTTGISATGNITGNNVIASGTLTVGTFNPTSLSASGNITGGNIRTAGLITATGNITGAFILGNGSQLTGLSGSSITNGTSNVVVASSGNVSIAVTGNNIISITSTGIINNLANGTGNIGNSTGYFNTIFAKATSAQYADLAEMYLSDGPLHPGTVVEFGGSNEITIAVVNHSSRVAGIISTRPSHLMNATLTGDHAYPVALTGRVPCTVIGRISKGDCLVSGDHPGAAQRLDQEKFVPGCIIGKALQDHDSDSIGTIEVAVGRF